MAPIVSASCFVQGFLMESTQSTPKSMRLTFGECKMGNHIFSSVCFISEFLFDTSENRSNSFLESLRRKKCSSSHELPALFQLWND